MEFDKSRKSQRVSKRSPLYIDSKLGERKHVIETYNVENGWIMGG